MWRKRNPWRDPLLTGSSASNIDRQSIRAFACEEKKGRKQTPHEKRRATKNILSPIAPEWKSSCPASGRARAAESGEKCHHKFFNSPDSKKHQKVTFSLQAPVPCSRVRASLKLGPQAEATTPYHRITPICEAQRSGDVYIRGKLDTYTSLVPYHACHGMACHIRTMHRHVPH